MQNSPLKSIGFIEFIEFFCFVFFGMRLRFGTLGARGFSCAVSGFGQVLKSVSLRPKKRSSPTHARKTSGGDPGQRFGGLQFVSNSRVQFFIKKLFKFLLIGGTCQISILLIFQQLALNDSAYAVTVCVLRSLGD